MAHWLDCLDRSWRARAGERAGLSAVADGVLRDRRHTARRLSRFVGSMVLVRLWGPYGFSDMFSIGRARMVFLPANRTQLKAE